MTQIDELLAPFAKPIVTADDYFKSLSRGGLNVSYMDKRVGEPVDHPVLRLSANAVAETYRLAAEYPELDDTRAEQGELVNRFLMELTPSCNVSLGIGVPGGIADVAAEKAVRISSPEPPSLEQSADFLPAVAISACDATRAHTSK